MNERKGCPKHSRYQDYVIKDGKLIGDFETMYQDHEDPWNQTEKERYASDKAITINLIRRFGIKRVMELGSGLGHFSQAMTVAGASVLGMDISETAVKKAEQLYPDCKFVCGNVLDFKHYLDFKPEMIVFAEITWYILKDLDNLLKFLKTELKTTYIVHLLSVYPAGVQNYGKEVFTDLTGIMKHFGMEYLEWGEIYGPNYNGNKTYFFGRWK